MAVTLSAFGRGVDGTVGVAAGGTLVASPSGADTYTLPKGDPVGFGFELINTTANVITVAAPSGETIAGASATTTAGSRLTLRKLTATGWRGYLTT